ncbi:hypothetical protein ACMFMG_012229 [Clarireedia jacksonii]
MEDEYWLDKARIAKLNKTNYRAWSIQVETLLMGLGLWDVVEVGLKKTAAEVAIGLSEKPISTDPEWEAKDAKARSIIMVLCSQEALDHILLCESASAQWEALDAQYRPQGMLQLRIKIRAFTDYKVPKGSAKGIVEVANQLSNLQWEIGSIEPKEKPSDLYKLATLYRVVEELDHRFEPLILQLEMMETPLDFENTVAKLTEWERRLGPREGTKEGALGGHTPPNGKKGPKGRGKKFQGP